jgi:antitoxin (DNA-binding transcriptional repressor) of toxin-antitoxin stability system
MLDSIDVQTIPAPMLSDLIKQVTEYGEIALTDGGRVVAKIVPVPATLKVRPKPQFGSAKGRITVPDDFDEPLECFKEYMPEPGK